jgi:large subunit ribosomal protein L25
MEKVKISTEPRKVLGKKVKNLRKEGILPANLFGKNLKSKAVQLPDKDFRKVFKLAGETGIVELKVKEEVYPVLIHNVQHDPLTDSVTHVDFHKVNLKEKITARVPIKLVGESPAEKSKVGLILQTIDEIEIKSLPTDIPHEIEVDISNLSEVGQTVPVKDLKIDREKIEVENEPEEVVLSVQSAEMKEEPVEEEKTPEEVEATAEKGEEEEAEGKEEGKEEVRPERGEAESKEKAPEAEGKPQEKTQDKKES